MSTSPADLLTSAEVCERLGIDRSTLSRWVQVGRIQPAVKMPGIRGAFLFEPRAIEALATERAEASA